MPPPEGPVRVRRDPRRARAGRPAVRRADQPSRLPGLHPGRGNVAGCARRPDRERAQPRHLLVARRVGAERARARRARLVPAMGRLSGGRGGRARLGRLGGQPDGARLRAGGARRRDGRARGRLHVRPDPLLGRARGTRARVPARPGARSSRPTSGARMRLDALRERDRRRPKRQAGGR